MTEGATASTLEAARAAFEQGEFAEARELYEVALKEEPSAEALDGLGQALWLTGARSTPRSRGARRPTFELRRAGNVARAAEMALWLVIEQATSLGNQTAAGGWFKRAEPLLAEAPLCPAHAQLEVQRTFTMICRRRPRRAGHRELPGRVVRRRARGVDVQLLAATGPCP